MALLVDLGSAPDCACTDALEHIFKAMAVDPHGDIDRTMWAPHPVALLRPLVEVVTRQMQRRLEAAQDTLGRALTGEPIGTLAKAMAWERLDEDAMREARARLEAKPPAEYSLEDWLELIELVFHRHLPRDFAMTMGEWLAVRATLAGKIGLALAANADAWKTPEDHIAELLPQARFGKLPRTVLTPVERSILSIAKVRAALHISDVTEAARSRMRTMIVEHVQAIILGQSEGTTERLRQRLFDNFGRLNRDFRRIAVTEAGECAGQGFIASCQPGQRVRRLEHYTGACDFCRSINGRIFRVVAPDDPAKDGDRDVWVGKTNVGRSSSPRKRVGGDLIEREPAEMWWVAAGVMHPHCRGNWIPVLADGPKPGVDPDFHAWMRATLDAAVPRPKPPKDSA